MDRPDPNAPHPIAPPAPIPPAPFPPAPFPPAPDPSQSAPLPASLKAARKRARSRHDPYAHRRGEPRTFAILWMVFMVAAILISLSPIGASGIVSVESYRPSARLLAALMAIGIAVVWPMIRLSQVRPRAPVRAVAQDQIIVMVPITAMCAAQTAPWMAGWPTSVGAAMAVGLLGWSIFVAGVLLHAFANEARCDPEPTPPPSPRELDQGVGRHPDAATRVLAMLILMVIAIVGPLVSAKGYSPQYAIRSAEGLRVDWGLMTSPVGFALEVARDRVWTGHAAAVGPNHWWGILAIFLLGLCSILTARFRLNLARNQAKNHAHNHPRATHSDHTQSDSDRSGSGVAP